MRKFLLPIINIVNVILVSITFGLGANPSISDTRYSQINYNYYNLVWVSGKDHANVLGIVGFFLLCVGAFVMLLNFLPVKFRKITTIVAGAMLVAAGVLFLKTPFGADINTQALELSGSLIAMAVLTIIAGAFSLAMSVIEILPTKKNN